MLYHLIAFTLGIVLDRIVGDPPGIPHPIRLIGSGIGLCDRLFLGEKGKSTEGSNFNEALKNHPEKGNRNKGWEFLSGLLMSGIMLILTGIIVGAILCIAYRIHPFSGITVECVMTCYIMAAKSLKTESMKVYHALKERSIDDARFAVSMIVGRDTDSLDLEGVSRAAVETVAENTSDGVIAPLIYTFIGGPVGGFLYKTVNTMDSMVGYHSERYEYFGKTPAKLDDLVNFLPARISALFMILSAYISGSDYSGKGALSIFIRDRYNHKSPNSAQTESVCAGALSVRLAGDASYFGKIVKKPYIGDDIRKIEPEDIKRACRLMYNTEFLCAALLIVIGIIILCNE